MNTNSRHYRTQPEHLTVKWNDLLRRRVAIYESYYLDICTLIRYYMHINSVLCVVIGNKVIK